LSQSARHAFCARCDFSFDDPTPAGGGGTPSAPLDLGVSGDHNSDAAAQLLEGEDAEPTVEDPPPTQPEPPDRSIPLVDVKRTAPALPPDTVEEALPDAPTWSMPGRGKQEAAPGRGWGETTGRARRTPGLAQDRGSLSGRGRDTASSMKSVSGDFTPQRTPSAPPPRSHPGLPGSELRGRPPGSLYADEHSSPPGDPLMAALVSGDEYRTPIGSPLEDVEEGSPPVHPLYPEGPPSDSDFGAVETLSEPALRAAGPRVVPPSTGRRASSVGQRRRSSNQKDPRGRPVASVPGAGIQPDSARPAATADLVSGGRVESLPATAPPAPVPEPPRSQPGPPIPPAPSVPETFKRPGVDSKKLARNLALLGVAVVLVLAGRDAYRMFGNLGSLNSVLDVAQAKPALPRELEGAVVRLELERDIQRRWARIRGENDTYAIGVEVEHRIVGVPVRYTAERDGRFRLDSQLPTLSYFVDGGWQLDEAAERKLSEYEARRRGPPPQ